MSQNDDSLREAAERSADWLIARLALEASGLGQPFDGWEQWVLRQSVDSFSETTTPKAVETHDYAVRLMRSAIVRDIESSGQSLDDPDPEIPGRWLSHYESMRLGELQWLVFFVSHSVFFGNEVDSADVASDGGGARQENQMEMPGENRPQKLGLASIVIGFGIAAIGLLVTFATYAAAGAGGTYLVAWGAILFGAFEGFKGIYRYLRS